MKTFIPIPVLLAAFVLTLITAPLFAAEGEQRDHSTPPTLEQINLDIARFEERLKAFKHEYEALRKQDAESTQTKQLGNRITLVERAVKNWKLLREHYRPTADQSPAERLRLFRAAAEKLKHAGHTEFAANLARRAGSFANPSKPKANHPPAPLRTDFSVGYSADAPATPVAWVKPVEPSANAGALFTKRILPIFNSPKPSSCNECHLSGVDLKDYLFPDQAKTFAAMVKGKLIDVKNPDGSKILEFISRRPAKASLVKDKVRREEFEAFRAWIHAAVKDTKLFHAKSTIAAGPQLPPEVIRHARTDRVLSSFLENVWSEIERCVHCHDPNQNQKQVERHGVSMSWITPDDPLATLAYLKRGELIDLDNPEKSLILTKPTMEVEHKGGRKMLKGDLGYRQFLTFINDYAATVKGEYKTAEQLPKAARLIPTVAQIALRITDIPEQYRGKLLRTEIHRWSDAGWSKDPVATAAWTVFPKKLIFQSRLTLLAPRGSKQVGKKELPAGRYLAKIFIDFTEKLNKDGLAELGAADFVGQVDFHSNWKTTPKNPVILKFPELRLTQVRE